MTTLLIICLAIVLTDTIRISLMGRNESLVWGVIWMICAYFSTIWLTELSLQDVYSYINIHAICVLGFIEILIFMSYLFYNSKGKNLLAFYPGLMMIVPISVLAYLMSRIGSGISFFAFGFMSAVMAGVFLFGIVLFLRWLKSDRAWLYVSSVATLIIYILIYGVS